MTTWYPVAVLVAGGLLAAWHYVAVHRAPQRLAARLAGRPAPPLTSHHRAWLSLTPAVRAALTASAGVLVAAPWLLTR